ncbi:rhomboid family intramembrane serine protease [Flavobacteriales bacterium]|jgi:membrane associated rhomboid family serine protease|nr:rhomboid family intramembrane serine protease [Flavobacteriales bacterium]
MLPPVVKNLLIINGIFFLAKWALGSSLGIDLDNYLGLHYWKSPLFEVYQIVTYLFMHGDIMHLFFNMFAVWMFGSAIENVWGQKRFLKYYLATGFGAAALHYVIVYFQIASLEAGMNVEIIQKIATEGAELLVSGRNYIDTDLGQLNLLYHIPIVGASGSLFGLLLAFGMLFPNNEIYIYMLFPLKAKYFVAIYGAIELFSGVANQAGDNVAHFAHLGGMLFGFIIITYWKKSGKGIY